MKIQTLLILGLIFLGCDSSSGGADGYMGYTLGDGQTEPDSESDVTAPDVTEVEEEVAEPDPPEPVKGCSWATGSWLLVDCQGGTIAIEFVTNTTTCTTQIVSSTPSFSNATGIIRNGALEFKLMTTLSLCHAVFDGSRLLGACSTIEGPCAFEAVPNN